MIVIPYIIKCEYGKCIRLVSIVLEFFTALYDGDVTGHDVMLLEPMLLFELLVESPEVYLLHMDSAFTQNSQW